MIKRTTVAALLLSASGMFAQSPAPDTKFAAFEVATVKPTDYNDRSGRFITLQGTHRFVVKNYTLKLLIASAYDLNPRTIAGGPAWISSEHYDILALTPEEVRPDHEEQMFMLRSLLTDRFKLRFHREQKEFSIYALEISKNGPKLKVSAERPDQPPVVGPATVYPQRVSLPGRNATMGDFVSCYSGPYSIGRSWIRRVFREGTILIWCGLLTKLNLEELCRRCPQTSLAHHCSPRFRSSSA